jgi:GxxExxY protein
MPDNELTEKIIGCAYTLSNTLGAGFLEKVYENALVYELRKQGLAVEQQKVIDVLYDGTVVGEYFADLLVEDCVIVELKAVRELNAIHQAQLMNYLNGCNIRIGLLLNFGTPKIEIKRIVNGY